MKISESTGSFFDFFFCPVFEPDQTLLQQLLSN